MAKLLRRLKAALRRQTKKPGTAPLPATSDGDSVYPSTGLLKSHAEDVPPTQGTQVQPPVAKPDNITQKQSEPTASTVGLLSLPGELRNVIYESILVSVDKVIRIKCDMIMMPALFRVNRQIRAEASSVYFLANKFTIGPGDYFWMPTCVPIQAFLSRTGAQRYTKTMRIDWRVSDHWRGAGLSTPRSWEDLVDWASGRWICNIPPTFGGKVVWPAGVHATAFEVLMVLVATHHDWDHAILAMRFTQWLDDLNVDWQWTFALSARKIPGPVIGTSVSLSRPL